MPHFFQEQNFFVCQNRMLRFCEVSRNPKSIRCWKFQLSMLTNKKVLFLKKICGMLVIETLKSKISWIVTRASARDYTIFPQIVSYGTICHTEGSLFQSRIKKIQVKISKFNIQCPLPSTTLKGTTEIAKKYHGTI